ncbi:MAG: large subunit ribosomal protein [Patescibacteria group bacterium]|nr:large subunit ribosomal protein [Patescibacteria group bacterium]
MKAVLKNYRQSPRKVRLIADLIKGKRVDVAMQQLDLFIKRGSLPMKKLLAQAVANSGKEASSLVVKNATVDKGLVMKRYMPRAFGRASQILKRSSHIAIELSEAKTTKK